MNNNRSFLSTWINQKIDIIQVWVHQKLEVIFGTIAGTSTLALSPNPLTDPSTIIIKIVLALVLGAAGAAGASLWKLLMEKLK
jgi:hypothetical protein